MNSMTGQTRKQKKKNDYVFCLYVTGASPNSARAITNTRNFCKENIGENYELQIIDVYQQPNIASKENIIALPMLIKKYPLPEKRMIGDMADIERALKIVRWSNGKE